MYLDVPFAEKDAAKALGARLDQSAKRWFDPRPPSAGPGTVGRPAGGVRPPAGGGPNVRGRAARGDGATLVLVHQRTCVSPQDWERLARMVYRRAGQRCEACGAKPSRAAGRRLEAHERWAFDERIGVQALWRLICLCDDCHLSTHLGFGNVTGHAEQALTHLCAVTGMTDAEVRHHVVAAGDLWTARLRQVWTLDLSMLAGAGVTVQRPEPGAARPAVAKRALRQAQTSAPAPIPALLGEQSTAGHSLRPTAPPQDPSPHGLWTRITGRRRLSFPGDRRRHRACGT